MESIALKEWALVCEALGGGEQSIILRKGGIAEGPAGFSFRHREFFLFPTSFHEQIGKVRMGKLPARDGNIPISLFAKVERAVRIESLEVAQALEPLHVLSADLVRERFTYKSDGLNVAFVRVFQLEPRWILPDEKRFGGCRSWIELPEPPNMSMQPVMDDTAHAERCARFNEITLHYPPMSSRA